MISYQVQYGINGKTSFYDFIIDHIGYLELCQTKSDILVMQLLNFNLGSPRALYPLMNNID